MPAEPKPQRWNDNYGPENSRLRAEILNLQMRISKLEFYVWALRVVVAVLGLALFVRIAFWH